MEEVEILVVEEEDEMVAPFGGGVPTKRIGRFIEPRANSTADAASIPAVPSLREAVSCGFIPWPPKKATLEGWRYPQPKWKEWVEKLRSTYKDVWEKAGIFDAIVASTNEIRRHPSVLFAFLLYWCSETNTFVFPWSEATITLEDVMVLGGFPVLGESIRMTEPLTGEHGELLQKMTAERKGFNKLSSKKASHYEWIKHYMEVGRGDQLEHIAFLSLWLSRFVFPAPPGKTIAENVFPIAIRLAHGMRIALGPAVLASLYRDLRLLRNSTFASRQEEAPSITAWAPFQILQLWAWEHFVALRLGIYPNFLQANEPRAARWGGLDAKLELSYVISVIESPNEFQWRPYTTHMDDWCLPSFYKDDGQWVSFGSDDNDAGVKSYAHFLRASELVGIDCIEQYLPHRVAMQFGLDQDLPGIVPRANATSMLAWETYNKDVGTTKLYISPRLFESDCTQKFLNWHQECFMTHNQSGESKVVEHEKLTILYQEMQKEAQNSCKIKGMNLEDQICLTPADEQAYDNRGPSLIKMSNGKPLDAAADTDKLQPFKADRRMSRKRKLSNIYKVKFRQYEDGMHHLKNADVKQEREEDYDELFHIEDEEFLKGLRKPSVESVYVPKATADLGGEHSPSYIRFKHKEQEERIRKELELDAQIARIKTEIAELQTKAMNMEIRSELGIFILSST